MQYDPIKHSLGKVFNKKPFLRKLFYRMLDLLLLRTWHIKKEIRLWSKSRSINVNILDAGSGFGQYSYFLTRFNPKYTITGIDVKTEQIEDCTSFFKKIGKNQVCFKIADLTTYTEPETYDMILSVDVMEHILEDVLVFKNFHASLKTGGIVLISTPSDQGGSDAHHEKDESFIEEHVRNGYNINEIQDKLKLAGFSKTEAHYSYGKPGSLSWRLSMKFPILMLGVSKLFFIIIPLYYLIVFPFCILLNYSDVKGKHGTGTGLIVKAWK
jgi:SAM-dependent methyltransferase